VNTYSVHGSALGLKVEAARNNLQWHHKPFHVRDEVKRYTFVPNNAIVKSSYIERKSGSHYNNNCGWCSLFYFLLERYLMKRVKYLHSNQWVLYRTYLNWKD
jgi:hypothetical protein